MARKSIQELLTEITVLLNDNSAGEITPLDLRTVLNDIAGIIQPSYGVFDLPGPDTFSSGLTDVVLPWTTFISGGAVQYTAAGLTVISCDQRAMTAIDLSLDVEGLNGRVATATLYANGVATRAAASVVCQGVGKPMSLNFSILNYQAAASSYELRIKCDTANTTLTFSNGVLILSNVPVNSFT